MKMEVRCCCVPKKLLGWVEVSDGVRNGNLISLFFSESLSIKYLTSEPSYDPKPYLTLPVCEIHVNEKEYLALKSNETPIETLRKLSGFTENFDRWA